LLDQLYCGAAIAATNGEHILGFMLSRAIEANMEHRTLLLAYTHIKALAAPPAVCPDRSQSRHMAYAIPRHQRGIGARSNLTPNEVIRARRRSDSQAALSQICQSSARQPAHILKRLVGAVLVETVAGFVPRSKSECYKF
jgi:hypothetical protein